MYRDIHPTVMDENDMKDTKLNYVTNVSNMHYLLDFILLSYVDSATLHNTGQAKIEKPTAVHSKLYPQELDFSL